MKNILIIGGTGIIGKPLVFELLRLNTYNICTVSLEKAHTPSFPSSVKQIIVDRYSPTYQKTMHNLLNKTVHQWEAVIDIIAYDNISAEQTHRLFHRNTNHIITFSTALVYDRSTNSHEPISEETPLAKQGKYGGYVDGKLRLETYWQQVTDVHWTLVRPYHVVGKWTLLGCTPYHNRDPKLLKRIQNREPLQLASGGNIFFNYIHPNDIAKAICKLIGNKKAFYKAYNLVNPIIISAKEYYKCIANYYQKQLTITPVSIKKIWEDQKGWEMTTFPHLYSVEKLQKDTGYIPNTPLIQAVKDAIQYQPSCNIPKEHIPVHAHMNTPPNPIRPAWLE